MLEARALPQLFGGLARRHATARRLLVGAGWGVVRFVLRDRNGSQFCESPACKARRDADETGDATQDVEDGEHVVLFDGVEGEAETTHGPDHHLFALLETQRRGE